jgi:type 1 glutamine amidotransferase
LKNRLALILAATALCAFAQNTPRIPGQNPNGLRVFIWAGLKTHSVGEHDYPQFLADWSKLLTEKGAVINGALRGPSAADLEQTDVVVIYKGDAGFMNDAQKAALEAYVNRGGGLVSLHDALCGPDPVYFSKLIGGAKKHGEVNYTLGAPITLEVVDKQHPIMKDMTNLTIYDESFYTMTWSENPKIHVLATNSIPGTPSAGTHKGEVVPQIWTLERPVANGQTARSFAFMQGHTYANFQNYQIQRTLLRGIAWAAKRPVDELVEYVQPPRPQRPARAEQPSTGAAR